MITNASLCRQVQFNSRSSIRRSIKSPVPVASLQCRSSSIKRPSLPAIFKTKTRTQSPRIASSTPVVARQNALQALVPRNKFPFVSVDSKLAEYWGIIKIAFGLAILLKTAPMVSLLATSDAVASQLLSDPCLPVFKFLGVAIMSSGYHTIALAANDTTRAVATSLLERISVVALYAAAILQGWYPFKTAILPIAAATTILLQVALRATGTIRSPFPNPLSFFHVPSYKLTKEAWVNLVWGVGNIIVGVLCYFAVDAFLAGNGLAGVYEAVVNKKGAVISTAGPLAKTIIQVMGIHILSIGIDYTSSSVGDTDVYMSSSVFFRVAVSALLIGLVQHGGLPGPLAMPIVNMCLITAVLTVLFYPATRFFGLK